MPHILLFKPLSYKVGDEAEEAIANYKIPVAPIKYRAHGYFPLPY
ncbi:hypothetical protein [Scytonema sp. NUACC21]